jgi:glucose dehydrogenase
MFYALNTKNGKILWEYQMNAAGSAPPTIFKHKDKQYVAVVSTDLNSINIPTYKVNYKIDW